MNRKLRHEYEQLAPTGRHTDLVEATRQAFTRAMDIIVGPALDGYTEQCQTMEYDAKADCFLYAVKGTLSATRGRTETCHGLGARLGWDVSCKEISEIAQQIASAFRQTRNT
jgi:hypothetical protein